MYEVIITGMNHVEYQSFGPFESRQTAEECVLKMCGKDNVISATIKEVSNESK